MRVTPIDVRYRGFDLGFALGLHGYLAAWRSSFDTDWQISSVYADDRNDVERLAQQCIDYRYRVEATEAVLGRKLKTEELKPDL